jgi:hypothetical protein
MTAVCELAAATLPYGKPVVVWHFAALAVAVMPRSGQLLRSTSAVSKL